METKDEYRHICSVCWTIVTVCADQVRVKLSGDIRHCRTQFILQAFRLYQLNALADIRSVGLEQTHTCNVALVLEAIRPHNGERLR